MVPTAASNRHRHLIIVPQEFIQSICKPVNSVPSNLALPYDQHAPTGRPELSSVQGVPSFVAAQFLQPKVLSRRRNRSPQFAIVTVPEAAVNEHNLALTDKHQIRLSRKIRSVQSVSVAKRVSNSPNDHFGAGILRPNRGHAPRTLFRCQYISHYDSPKVRCNFLRNASIVSSFIPESLG